MGTVMFYHLTRSPAHQTLAVILPRAVQAGWRVLLRAAPETLTKLDTQLWQGAGFLPHGMAGGEMDADQPVLLGNLPSGGFDALALVGALELDPAEVPVLQRVWVLFDAEDAGQMAAARALWKTCASAGLHAQYWSEEGGTWTKKTETGAPAAP